MCGFIASFGQNMSHNDFYDAMNHLKRRGPDAEGIWNEKDVFFGSTRLAIFDLNERSNQPMISICNNYILVFNGSIYNYKDLRQYLLDKGIKLKTFSDTEVILELFILEGPTMLKRLKGMFAFVIWDKIKEQAFAARDPYGIKPLYIGLNNKGLILASQVKTLLYTKQFNNEKDLYSKFSFENFGYIIEPHTWFDNIKSLKSGHYIIIKENKIVVDQKWYEIEQLWINADKNIKNFNKIEQFKVIKNAITETVQRHLVADVPIGIFMSGGIDSTLLAALVSGHTKKDITAITILFDDFKNTENDETLVAKKVCEKLGINHFVYKVTKKDFYKDLPKILDAMDQPTLDGINTWYASKAASELNLKVVFSGLGGDEIFFGYDHFKKIPLLFFILKILNKIPFSIFIIKIILHFVSIIKKDFRWNFLLKYKNSILKLWFLKRSINKNRNSKNLLNENELHISDFFKEYLNDKFEFDFQNPKIHLSLLDSLFYMRNQLLRDSDWASMYHGIELRTPFVDIQLIEKLKDVMNNYSIYENKKILKLIFNSKLPEEVFNKKKIGFNTPVKKWYQEYLNSHIKDPKKYMHEYTKEIKKSFENYKQ